MFELLHDLVQQAGARRVLQRRRVDALVAGERELQPIVVRGATRVVAGIAHRREQVLVLVARGEHAEAEQLLALAPHEARRFRDELLESGFDLEDRGYVEIRDALLVALRRLRGSLQHQCDPGRGPQDRIVQPLEAAAVRDALAQLPGGALDRLGLDLLDELRDARLLRAPALAQLGQLVEVHLRPVERLERVELVQLAVLGQVAGLETGQVAFGMEDALLLRGRCRREEREHERQQDRADPGERRHALHSSGGWRGYDPRARLRGSRAASVPAPPTRRADARARPDRARPRSPRA
ncbi:MAG: hypothetical protein IPJ19_16380 [Planctomycetes bacterium]|nr:hypothetical protein [Planctomycetota bacterium]